MVCGRRFGLSVAVFLFLGDKAEWPVRLTVLGVPFTFIYFVQTHRLEETRLFKDLFDRFNNRYDTLNEKLNRIRDTVVIVDLHPLDRDDRNTLFDYFNLCGEEYLYFQLGYIPPEAWKAWYNGMRYFLEAPRIRRLWDEEAVSSSYYGLIFPNPKENAKIEDITALPCHRAA